MAVAGFQTWESFFYPETFDAGLGWGTLRNKFGERDFLKLRQREYDATAVRERELRMGSARFERTYGADHLRGIHRHLFQRR